jgi:hypothetical protein
MVNGRRWNQAQVGESARRGSTPVVGAGRANDRLGLEHVQGVSDQPGSSVPFAVAIVESLPDDDALLVEDKHARVRHAHVPGIGLDPVGGVVLLDPLVEEAESPDHVATLPSSDRRGNEMPCSVANVRRIGTES